MDKEQLKKELIKFAEYYKREIELNNTIIHMSVNSFVNSFVNNYLSEIDETEQESKEIIEKVFYCSDCEKYVKGSIFHGDILCEFCDTILTLSF